MTLTVSERAWHDAYERAPLNFKDDVNELYFGLTQLAREKNYRLTGDDRAEALIAAIAKYLIESVELE